jgi:hypothetical protein
MTRVMVSSKKYFVERASLNQLSFLDYTIGMIFFRVNYVHEIFSTFFDDAKSRSAEMMMLRDDDRTENVVRRIESIVDDEVVVIAPARELTFDLLHAPLNHFV